MWAFNRDNFVLIAVLGLAGALGVLNPVYGHASLLFFTASLIASRPSRALAPQFFLPFFGSAYFLLGGLNISTYRGSIGSEVMSMALLMVGAISLGCLMTGPRSGHSRRLLGSSSLVDRKVFYLTLVPGLVGLAMIAQTGFPLFFPGRFVFVSGKAFFLSELLFVPFCIAAANHISSSGVESRRWLGVAIGVVVLLALPGYRGWPIIAIVILTLLRWVSGRASTKGLLVSGGAVIALMAGLVAFRRAFDWELSSSDEILAASNAEGLGQTIGLLHISLRESIAISQWMIYSASHGIGGSLFLSDFMTLLPGTRPSGGVLVAQALGVTRGVGLTPGALGALVYEFGVRGCLVVSFCLGMAVGALCRWCLQQRTALTLCCSLLVSIYLIHYLHRGIPKPSYVLIPLALVLVFLLPRVAPRQR